MRKPLLSIALILIGLSVVREGEALHSTPGRALSGLMAAEPATETHWAFRKPSRPPVPKIKNKQLAAWIKNPMDAFIAASLEKKGLAPSTSADRRTLIRRATFDLTGLPPTPEETAAFLADKSPDAYEKVVKRLLASPHYGERWAQHWLDMVRFGETNGYELDDDRPQAWRYRDYVVRSLNEDKPYDRFIMEQIAGDEIAPDDFELRVATYFLRAGPQHVVGGNQEPAVNRQEWLTEATIGIGNVIMGLTINCARCHDHKFDPITQEDYYRLQAFFAATDNHTFVRATEQEKQAHEAAVKAHRERLKPIQDQIAAIEKPYRERLRQEKMDNLDPVYKQVLAIETSKRTPEQQRIATDANRMLNVVWDELVAALTPEDREKRATLRKQMHTLQLESPEPPPSALCVADVLKPVPPAHLLVRGDPHALGKEVQPGFVQVLNSGSAGQAFLPDAIQSDVSGKNARPTTGRRTILARWLTQPNHPLTGRVMVNRLWQHHFGRGIVGTSNDFGHYGQSPTHPELLDWLATEFVARGWSLKQMHYLIVTSNTYRQSSQFDAKKTQIDPENRLLWRMNRRRLDAETLRDSILHTVGNLNPEMGGPSVRIPLEPEVYDQIFTEAEPDNLWQVTPDAGQHLRRSLYLLHKRNVRLPMMVAFDAPDMMSPCAARNVSVHSLQALTLMNSEFMLQQSHALGKRLLREEPPSEDKRIERLYVLTLNRLPKPQELQATRRFLRDQVSIIQARIIRGEPVVQFNDLPTGINRATAATWADLCLAVYNLNEFVYVN